VQEIRGRRVQVLVAAAMAALLLVGAAGCGGSSDDGSEGSGAKSSQDGGGDKSSDSGGSSDDGGDEAAGDLPDPCSLVPIETASELLGGESAEPDSTSNDIGTTSRSCSWQTQDSIDNPTLDGAGHILSLTLISPVGDYSTEEFFDLSEEGATDEADVDGCAKAFWTGGMLSAYQKGVYLTGSAGLADTSPDAKEATTKLVAAACAGV